MQPPTCQLAKPDPSRCFRLDSSACGTLEILFSRRNNWGTRHPLIRSLWRTKTKTAGIAPGCFVKTRSSFRLLGAQNQRLQAGVQAALVARHGVEVEDALLHALVESRSGRAVLLLGGFDIAGSQGFAHRAQTRAYTAAVGAVYSGALHI